jgi:hypothetical protein
MMGMMKTTMMRMMMRRWGGGPVTAISSISASDWDDLEQEEEDDVPQWPSSPFLFHAMKQGKEKTPLGQQRWTALPRTGSPNNMLARSGLVPMRRHWGSRGPAPKAHCLMAFRYVIDPPILLLS